MFIHPLAYWGIEKVWILENYASRDQPCKKQSANTCQSSLFFIYISLEVQNVVPKIQKLVVTHPWQWEMAA